MNCNSARKTPHSLVLSTFAFVFTSPSDSDSSLNLFVAVLTFEDGFFAKPSIFDGGLEAFAFGFTSSSSSEAKGSSSTFFFFSRSLGLALDSETGTPVFPSCLSSFVLTSTSSCLDFAASRSEKNLSLSCCLVVVRRVCRGGRSTLVP